MKRGVMRYDSGCRMMGMLRRRKVVDSEWDWNFFCLMDAV